MLGIWWNSFRERISRNVAQNIKRICVVFQSLSLKMVFRGKLFDFFLEGLAQV